MFDAGKAETFLVLVAHMLNVGMHDEPPTLLGKFNAVFTKRRLLLIIGFLLGVLISRLLGLY